MKSNITKRWASHLTGGMSRHRNLGILRSSSPHERGGHGRTPKRYPAGMAMSSRRLALIAAVAPIFLAVTAIAGPAAATPPDTFSFGEQFEVPVLAECDGFTIAGSLTTHVTVRVFFDSGGDVQRFSVKTMADDVLTNNVTQRQVQVRGVFEEMFTQIGDTDEFSHTLVGYRYMGFAGGEGLVLQDVGRIVYDPEHNVVSLAGQHDAEPVEQDAVCAALT